VQPSYRHEAIAVVAVPEVDVQIPVLVIDGVVRHGGGSFSCGEWKRRAGRRGARGGGTAHVLEQALARFAERPHRVRVVRAVALVAVV
jgi:hypothetical protein